MDNKLKNEKVKPEVVIDEIESVEDEKLNTIFGQINLVNQKLRLEEDKILAEFIYNNRIFDRRYCIDKKDVLKVFNFYLSFAPVVGNLRENKLPNIVKRKIKSFIWKIKKRKLYKQQLKGE